MLGLTNLIDLVASDNVFANASLSGLSRLVSLRQVHLGAGWGSQAGKNIRMFGKHCSLLG